LGRTVGYQDPEEEHRGHRAKEIAGREDAGGGGVGVCANRSYEKTRQGGVLNTSKQNQESEERNLEPIDFGNVCRNVQHKPL